MAAEDLHHFGAIGWTAGCGAHYFGSVSEVRGAHNGWGYDRELPHVRVAKIVEAVHGPPGNA